MITKQFRFAVAILALAAMASLPVSAGQVVLRKAKPLRMRKIFNLRASASLASVPGWPTPKVQLVVENDTGVTFLAGVKVYWSISGSQASSQSERTGWFALQEVLSPGERVAHVLPVPTSYIPASAVKSWIL